MQYTRRLLFAQMQQRFGWKAAVLMDLANLIAKKLLK